MNKFYFHFHLRREDAKEDMKALKTSRRIFLFSMKKAVIGSKSFLQPIKKLLQSIKREEKKGTVHKSKITTALASKNGCGQG